MKNVNISGAKNAALPIIAATLLSRNVYYIKNIPLISDVFIQLNILIQFNVKYQLINKNTIIIDTRFFSIPDKINYTNNTRGTYYFIGSTVCYDQDLTYELDTGCKIDKRIIDYHIDLLVELGKNIKINTNSIEVSGISVYKNLHYNFKKPSVGATINAIFMFSKSNFSVFLYNYAKDPYIINTIDLLKKIGICIEYNNDYIKINGEKNEIINNTIIQHEIISDPIEAITYIIYSGINLQIDQQSSYTIGPININDLGECYEYLKNIGIYLVSTNILNYYHIKRNNFQKFNIVTGYFPLIYTDVQPFFTILALYIENQCCTITETIWNDRFKYINEINKLGFNINVKDNKIIINNCAQVSPLSVINLENIEYFCTDLRGGMALLLLMRKLGIKNTPTYEKIIERGYYDYEKNINIILENKNIFFEQFETKKLSNINIGGKCKYYCEIVEEEELINLIKYCNKNSIKFKLVGGGYNIYFGDYFDGLIIKNLYKKICHKTNNNKQEFIVSSGTELLDFIIYSLNHNCDITNLSCIPGTIGGAIYSNVSAYGLELSSIVKECKILDENENILYLKKEEMDFSYRNSILQKFNYVLLSVCCAFEPPTLKINETRNNFMCIWEKRYIKFKMDYTLGSIFKNIKKNDNTIYAWELIDKCNFRGQNINGITISDTHPNIFFNYNDTTPEEFNNLIYIVTNSIYKKFNIILETEIIYIC